MMTLTQQRDRNATVERIIAFLRRNRLTPADLTEIGGEDADNTIVRRVERTWALIAAEGLVYTDLEQHPAFTNFVAARRVTKAKAATLDGDGFHFTTVAWPGGQS